jgi:hypothetical protein
MIRQAIIEKKIIAIDHLLESKAEEISDFADFVIKKYEEHILNNNIQILVAKSQSFEFLTEEEDIYSITDSKEVYNG